MSRRTEPINQLTFTKAELQEYSGRVRPSAICRWLDKRGVAYVHDADGWPKVLCTALLDRPEPDPQTAEPSLRFV